MSSNNTKTISFTLSPVTFPVITFLLLVAYIEIDGFIGNLALWFTNICAILFTAAFLFGRYMYKNRDDVIRAIVEKGEYKNNKRKSGYYLCVYAIAFSIVAAVLNMHVTQIIWAILAMSIICTLETLKKRIAIFEILKKERGEL